MAETDKRKRRRIRPAPTVRQQAEKAQADAAKPKREKRSRVGSVFKTIFKPFKVFKKVGKYRVLRAIGKVFSFVGKIIWPVYFRNSWRELRLVTWPGWKLSWSLTYAVIIFAVIFGAFVAGLDYGLDKAFRHLLIGK